MSSIFYKFRSTIDYKTYQFDGLHISGADLKRAICSKENIRAESFDLILQNHHTKRVYSNDDLIPRNSSIVIQRVPRDDAEKLPKIQGVNAGIVTQNASAASASQAAEHISSEVFDKMSEAERLAHVEKVSTAAYRPENFQRGKTNIMSGPPPPTYTCNRCYQPGHWFKNCPMLTQKRTTGIPSQELVQTTADDPQAMLHPSGKYVIHKLHLLARQQGIKKADAEQLSRRLPPPALTCTLCGGLLRDAVLTACCGNSFCADCVTQKLIESEDGQCPGEGCKKKNLSVDALIPNRTARQSAQAWANESEQMGSSSPGQETEQTRIRIGLQPQPFRRPGSPFRGVKPQQQPQQPTAVAQKSAPSAAPTASTQPVTAASDTHRFNVGLPPPYSVAPPTQAPIQTGQGPSPQTDQLPSAHAHSIPPGFPAMGQAQQPVMQQPPPSTIASQQSVSATPPVAVIPPTSAAPPPMIAQPLPVNLQPSPNFTSPPTSVVIPANFSQPPPSLPPSIASSSASRSSELLPPGVTSLPPPSSLPPMPMPLGHQTTGQLPPPLHGINLPPSYGYPMGGLAPPGTSTNPVLDAWDVYLQKKDQIKREREEKRRKRESSSSSSSSTYSSSSSGDSRDRRRKRRPVDRRSEYADGRDSRDGRPPARGGYRGRGRGRGGEMRTSHRNTYRSREVTRDSRDDKESRDGRDGRETRDDYHGRREELNRNIPSLLDSDIPRPSNVRGDLFIDEKRSSREKSPSRKEKDRSPREHRETRDRDREREGKDTAGRRDDRHREDRDRERGDRGDRDRRKDKEQRDTNAGKDRRRERSPEKKKHKPSSRGSASAATIASEAITISPPGSERTDRKKTAGKAKDVHMEDDEAAIDKQIKEAEQLQKIQATVERSETIEFEVEEHEDPDVDMTETLESRELGAEETIKTQKTPASETREEKQRRREDEKRMQQMGRWKPVRGNIEVEADEDRQEMIKQPLESKTSSDIPETHSEEGAEAENESSHSNTQAEESTDERTRAESSELLGEESGKKKKKKHRHHKEKKAKKHKKENRIRTHDGEETEDGSGDHKHRHKKHKKKDKKVKKERSSEEERERKERKKAKRAKKEKGRDSHSRRHSQDSSHEDRPKSRSVDEERDEGRKRKHHSRGADLHAHSDKSLLKSRKSSSREAMDEAGQQHLQQGRRISQDGTGGLVVEA